jgi:hypothetical protein
MASGNFTYFQVYGYILPGIQSLFSLEAHTLQLSDIALVWVPVVVYLLIYVNVFLTAMIFKPLRPYQESRLVFSFIFGLIVGTIATIGGGFTGGIIFGLHEWTYHSFEQGTVHGTLYGVVLGLIFGLIVGTVNDKETLLPF